MKPRNAKTFPLITILILLLDRLSKYMDYSTLLVDKAAGNQGCGVSFFLRNIYYSHHHSDMIERDSPCASTHGRKRNKEESDDDHRLLWPPEELPPAFTIFFIFWLTPAHNNRSVSQLGIESKPIVLIGFRQSVYHYEEVQVEWRLLRAIENPHLVVTGSGPVGKVILNQFSVHVTWLALPTAEELLIMWWTWKWSGCWKMSLPFSSWSAMGRLASTYFVCDLSEPQWLADIIL